MPTLPFSRRYPLKVTLAILPPCRFQIMCVHPVALFNGGSCLADGHAVLDHGVALRNVDERDFMAERNIVVGLHLDGLVGLHVPASCLLARGYVGHHHAYHVFVAVYGEMQP